MQVPNDVGGDLEGAEEHEEEAEEDVEAADDQTLTHDLLFTSSPCKTVATLLLNCQLTKI